ncbi:anthranilate synthase family protein [Streptomyces sp. NBC_01408]|uniref:anthranilate synthase family protein n=1 Tax=Streptomyces sp. NBC_01408 TaxID=2903855 RepID=UPI00224D0B9D|nr:anthranilate synthase family protein [Streptomyces sp. NBC_01408]MCX4696571.1 anthranilate synthase family protein [Streptomyces sp. NBC_01408]
MSSPLLARVLGPNPPPFALLFRPEATGPGVIDVVVGDTATVQTLAQLRPEHARGARGPAGARHEVLALVPYRQIAERGFAAPEEDTPLVAMTVTGQERVSLVEALALIPDLPIELEGGRFDVSDEEYADTVRRVISDEIGEGKGANFVIKRSWSTGIREYSTGHALTLFRRLLERESGAYWTFLVHTGERTLVGASPERHVSLHHGAAVMNPISGTYRYPAAGPSLPEVMDFLADTKETDELYMVVDEELKMMARICEGGARVDGPYLKEMARLAHTEYFIEGRSERAPEEILRETLFAPTVTGSPLESAASVIAAYEPQGRGYYSGVLALIGRDEEGGHALDSSILIRTADIGAAGEVRIGVGATLVRHSDPWSEVAETKAKAAGLLAALESRGGRARFASHPHVRAALEERNRTIAGYWLGEEKERTASNPALAGRRVLVVDAEDTFTAMIARQLHSLGLDVTVRRFDEPYAFDEHDLVVMGPGPGDPRDAAHPKIEHLRSAVRTLVDERRPFLAVCLSHQVLSTTLGFELVRRAEPNQGVQKEIDFFGRRERVGFYNTFAARSAVDSAIVPGVGLVDISRDPLTGEVHALRGPHFASMQFHAESVLTQNGPRIIGEQLASLTARMLAA